MLADRICRTVLAVIIVAMTAAGCGVSQGVADLADALQEQLGEAPGWATSMTVDADRNEVVGDFIMTVVDLRADATPSQVADFIGFYATAAAAAGVPEVAKFRQVVFRRPDHDILRTDLLSPVAVEPAMRPAVLRWAAVLAATEGLVLSRTTTLEAGGVLEHRVIVANTTAVADLYARIAGGADLVSAVDRWAVVSNDSVEPVVRSTSPP